MYEIPQTGRSVDKKVDWCLSGGSEGMENEETATVYEVSRGGGGEAVLKSGGDDSCTKL